MAEWSFSLQVAMSGSYIGRMMLADDVATTRLVFKRISTVGKRMENYHEG
jgi:hypothetical protein